MRVEDGKVVRIHYKLSVGGNEIEDSGSEPLAYLHGSGQIVPGLERQMAGKSAGDKFSAVIDPEDGYGKRDGEPQKVPRGAFPDGMPLEAGMQLGMRAPDGGVIPLWVVSAGDDEVVVDTNHPLAGETLSFQIEVIEVREATAEEISHGHVHGPGGAHS
jgi:FKBP-type peptidyl-prolyl cis-trans isomerase SlyD